MRRRPQRLLALVALLLPAAAGAHQATVSYSELEVHGAQVQAQLRFSLVDLKSQGAFEAATVPASADAIARLVLDPFVLKANGAPCSLGPVTARMDGDDGVVLNTAWTCPSDVETLAVKVGYLDSFPIGHTHLSRISFGGSELSQRVAQAEDPSFEVRRARNLLRDAGRFVLLGITHIFTGYDHIAFLIALLLLGGSLRALVKIVTAFTLAHSITLALATLGLLSPPSRVVEPMIAASIVYVGAENLWALRARREGAAIGHRWMLTFAFGLVHGFGFSAVLRELELPRGALATALVSFNLGVEAGQVCIVALLLPLLALLRRQPWFERRGVQAASLVICLLGAFWLVQRIV